jgi:Asp-tRNA(Asn)/Glu-tRNA(Gln) amidotransferase A subunit family amidase
VRINPARFDFDEMAHISAADIIALSATELAGQIRVGRVTAAQALAAYQARAATVHHATNSLTAWAAAGTAEAEAAALDAHFAATGEAVGPLHGVPVTIKDHYQLKGAPVTMGLAQLKASQLARGGARRDSALVLALRKAGAVVFAKTNMTQLGDTWGGGNPAYGDTLNPWDTLRTTGGSSSGEGAVVGGGGSPLGFGSDVGGSVRIPAAFCGAVGFKPTAQRFTFNAEDGKSILSHPGDCKRWHVLVLCMNCVVQSVFQVALHG